MVPFPIPDTTPPETKMYFTLLLVLSLSNGFTFVVGTINCTKLLKPSQVGKNLTYLSFSIYTQTMSDIGTENLIPPIKPVKPGRTAQNDLKSPVNYQPQKRQENNPDEFKKKLEEAIKQT